MERRGPGVEPREIRQEGDSGLSITWGDGAECSYKASDLRRSCPCAQCVNEWTGERILKPEAIPDAISISDISIVGRYALNFRWSDGHETGIYSFRYLRELCEEEQEAEETMDAEE
ncbi:MAG: DUF971 domain-containing protein [Acidobacteriota bacterium]|nr:DUF971 domain-containing protein [Acidobacteriota bacterium]